MMLRSRSYPEHEKAKENEVEMQIINDFINFLSEHSTYCIRKRMEYDEINELQEYLPVFENEYAELISQFFGIDYKVFLEEKSVMLDDLRADILEARQRNRVSSVTQATQG